MPTVGWIWDSDNDDYYAAWSNIPQPRGEVPQTYRCPFCISTFTESAALRSHLDEEHTGKRPFLTIDGVEPKSPEILRANLGAHSVEIFDSTSISISYDNFSFEFIDPEMLGSILERARYTRIWIRLENNFSQKNSAFSEFKSSDLRGAAARVSALQHPKRSQKTPPTPISQDYDLSFKVYDEMSLHNVDKAFVQFLGRDNVVMDDISKFLSFCRQYNADEYSDALASYVIAVLIKDGDPAAGVRAARLDYRSKFSGALRVLQDYERPLPHLVATLIRFSSCDFSHGRHLPSGSDHLDAAVHLLSPIARDGSSLEAPKEGSTAGHEQLFVCPVDLGSATVMRRAAQLAETVRWGPLLQAQLAAEADVATLDPLDREKLYALWAQAAMRLAHEENALTPLRALAGSYSFGQWAENLLSELEGQ